MLKYARTGLLAVVVVTGVLLPTTRYALLTWIAGGGFVLVLVLGRPAMAKHIEPGKDQPPGRSIQR